VAEMDHPQPAISSARQCAIARLALGTAQVSGATVSRVQVTSPLRLVKGDDL